MENSLTPVTRRLVAILALDAANFSRLVAQDEELTLRRLSECRQIIDSAIAKHGGRIVTTAGDSVLAEFASSVQAVRAAIDIQQALRTRNVEASLVAPMQFRVAVNVGDVVVDGDNILGDGVNVAVRLENMTPPEGICISAAVRDYVAGKLDVRFVDLGTQYLRNIPRPIRAFQVIPELAGSESFAKKARRAGAKVAWGAAAAIALLGSGAWLSATRAPVGDQTASTMPTAVASADERAYWDSVKRAADPNELRAYLASFPNGVFAELAKARLEGLLESNRRHAHERELAAKTAAAAQAQSDAARLRSEAESAMARAASEQAAALRLRTDAEVATARASTQRAATEGKSRTARAPEAPAQPPTPFAFVRTISPLDGRWTSEWACEASADQPAATIRLPAEVQYREVRIEAGQVGLPGHFRAYGSITEDGAFQLQGISVARSQRIVSNEDAMQVSGRIESDRAEGTGHIGKRRCTVVMTRNAAQ